MVDDSWGVTPPRGGLRVRTNDSLEERAAARAKAREARAADRGALMAERMEARAAFRERETLARETERAARREAEEAAARGTRMPPPPSGTAPRAARMWCANSGIPRLYHRGRRGTDSRIVQTGGVAIGPGGGIRHYAGGGRTHPRDGRAFLILPRP